MIEHVYADTMEPLGFTYEPEESEVALFSIDMVHHTLEEMPNDSLMGTASLSRKDSLKHSTLLAEANLLESGRFISNELHMALAKAYLPKLLQIHRNFSHNSPYLGQLTYAERCEAIGVSAMELLQNAVVAKRMLHGEHEIDLVG